MRRKGFIIDWLAWKSAQIKSLKNLIQKELLKKWAVQFGIPLFLIWWKGVPNVKQFLPQIFFPRDKNRMDGPYPQSKTCVKVFRNLY